MAEHAIRSETRAYIERVGNLSAARQSVVMPILIILSVGSLSRGLSAPLEQIGLTARGLVIAGFFAWFFFTVFGLALNLVFRRATIARGIAFFFVFGLTETVRALALAFFLSSSGVPRSAAWEAEATSAFLTGLALFSIASLFVGDSRQYRADLVEMMRQRDRLKRALGEVQLSIRSRRDDLLQSVRDVISSALKAVLDRRREGDRIDAGLVAELNRISFEVVRPLSHSLYAQTGLDDLLSTRLDRPKVRLTRVVTLASRTRPFRPLALAIVLVLLAGPAALFTAQPLQGALILLGMLGWTVLSLELARRFIAPRLGGMRFVARVASIYAVYIVFIVVTSLPVNALTQWSDVQGAVARSLYILFFGIPVLTVLAITPGIREARAEVVEALELTNKNLTWLSARLGAELWADRRSIARSLHQDVQSVLVAASFRLRRALESGEDVATASREVEQIIEMAASFVVSPSATPTMSSAVDALRERWTGIVTIDYEAEEPAAQSLGNDRVARQVLQEALAEFTLNGVKHGLATHVSVRVAMPGPRLLSVEMWNDGAPISEDAVFQGLGSRMVEKMGLSGGYSNDAGRVVFRATAPVVVEGDDGLV